MDKKQTYAQQLFDAIREAIPKQDADTNKALWTICREFNDRLEKAQKTLSIGDVDPDNVSREELRRLIKAQALHNLKQKKMSGTEFNALLSLFNLDAEQIDVFCVDSFGIEWPGEPCPSCGYQSQTKVSPQDYLEGAD